MNAQLLVDGHHELGEGVLWCERSQTVFWTDIHASRLWNHDPASGATRSWSMPERLCCFAFTADARRLLIGLASRLAFFDLDTGSISPICRIEDDLPTTRLNDGRCDRQGRFVFGTLNEDAGRDPIASFYRLNADLSLERLALPGIAISNSICFSLDGKLMYHCDSMAGKIMVCDYDTDSGAVSHQRVFADLAQQPGGPDGSTVDAEGYLWNAQWGGARVVRFAPDGSIDRIVEVRTAQPSCVAFGGAAFDTLFVTTAHEGMSAEQRVQDELAGGLFSVPHLDVRGLPEVRFAG
ncbi:MULTISPECIES: SMP-30/gluconolactonase/LRE family protein [unclassified Herbaspirillum]|uniref:SMP-30/gluconolactonase/LRE family protein n=1 Tax=unclassified Herbaspirillum TaxID=2624150 RepID=UPI000C094F95|nr:MULTISPECIES: SMP-30/gluconolactonase/LRE family protein [unclassified Herbaspirillum]MAF04531.1 gluconolaconase [Herbaspirillum sp.]MBO18051.1 gluconolaconase [Herbaspirillum sp.]|tara:strand:- start:1436 stop:2317 length:882 start_codon:yes stop_codon:yes gene_type:complete